MKNYTITNKIPDLNAIIILPRLLFPLHFIKNQQDIFNTGVDTI